MCRTQGRRCPSSGGKGTSASSGQVDRADPSTVDKSDIGAWIAETARQDAEDGIRASAPQFTRETDEGTETLPVDPSVPRCAEDRGAWGGQ